MAYFSYCSICKKQTIHGDFGAGCSSCRGEREAIEQKQASDEFADRVRKIVREELEKQNERD